MMIVRENAMISLEFGKSEEIEKGRTCERGRGRKQWRREGTLEKGKKREIRLLPPYLSGKIFYGGDFSASV